MSSIITGRPFESHSKSSSRKALFSCDWAFQEKKLWFRFSSWRVSAGDRAPMNYDSFYPTFCAAAQGRGEDIFKCPNYASFFVSDLNVQISHQEIGIKRKMMKPTSITALHTCLSMANDDFSPTICSARGQH